MTHLVFDSAGVMARLDNDRELLFELYDVFISDYESQLACVSEAIAGGAPKELRESAHAIKGALGNIGAMLAHYLAFQLENSGRDENLAGANETFASLKQAISDFQVEIEKFRAES